MWLFDDLLGGAKNKTQPQTPVTPSTPVTSQAPTQSTQTPAVDPSLVMTEQKTSTPPSVDALLNMSAGDTTANFPSYTAQKAAGIPVSTGITTPSAESLIISQTPAPVSSVDAPQSMSTPTLTFDIPQNTSTTITEVSTTPVMLSVVNDTPITPVSPEVSPSIATSLPTDSSPKTIQTETPVASTTTLESTSTPVAPEVSETPLNDSMFDLFGNDSQAIETSTVAQEKAPEVTPVANTTTRENTTSSEWLFGELDVDSSHASSLNEESIPDTTDNFIQANLKKLDAMESNITQKRNEFLKQAEQFKIEEHRFAALKREAIENSHSMDDEQERINTMRTYFLSLQKKQNSSAIHSTLAEVSVKTAVDSTMNPKPTAKRTTTAHKEKKAA